MKSNENKVKINKQNLALLVKQIASMHKQAHDARALVNSMHERTDTSNAREPPRRAGVWASTYKKPLDLCNQKP